MQKHSEYDIVKIGPFSVFGRSLNIMRDDIPVKTDVLVKNRSMELVRPVPHHPTLPRNYKSSCIVCWDIQYSLNSNRTFLGNNCMKLICTRDAFAILVDRRSKRKFKEAVIDMRRHMEGSSIVVKNGDDWSFIVKSFLRSMPWDIKNHFFSLLF